MQADETQQIKNKPWCVDSGATSHMCCEREKFVNFVEHTEEIRFEADKHIMT